MTIICPACGASVSVVNGIEKPHNSRCYMELCAYNPLREAEPGDDLPPLSDSAYPPDATPLDP